MGTGQKAALHTAVDDAIATASRINETLFTLGTQTVQNVIGTAAQQAATTSEETAAAAHRLIEVTTETVGRTVEPVATNPLVGYMAKIPGLNWLLNALGKVDTHQVQQEIDQLTQKYPDDTPEQIAHRIIANTALAAAGTGLATNIIPPVAVALFAVDLAALSKLQADMLFRIAAAYRFDLDDPARRGEALAVFALSLGSGGIFKTGLSFLEIIPGFGAVLGASSNAALVYSLGLAARQFYDTKYRRATGVPINQITT
ncbi:MAG: hypothetical protein AAFX51_07485 [Cyanobacteria bacterium J06636_28]